MRPEKRIVWIDTETTGTISCRNGIHQLSAVIDINSEIVSTFDARMRPFAEDLIDPKALAVAGVTKEQIMEYEEPRVVLQRFTEFLDEYGFSGKKDRRYIVGGYNVIFDLEFLLNWVKKCTGAPWAFWNHLEFNPIDPLPVVRAMWRSGILPIPNCQLGTVCDYYDIEIEAHEAMSDVLAARTLSYALYTPFLSTLAGRKWNFFGAVNESKQTRTETLEE